MVCRPSEVSENLFSFHAKRKALPSLGLLGQRVNIQCWRYNDVDTSSTCPHVAFNQGVHAWMSSIAQSRAAVTSGEKLPSLRVFSYSLCVYERRSREVRAATRWARPQLRTSTSSCPGVYWHSEHETTAGSVTDDWHRASHRENMFSHGVLTRQTVIHNTILSDPAHRSHQSLPPLPYMVMFCVCARWFAAR